MLRCAHCELPKEEHELFEVISKEGIVRVCKDCAQREEIPIIKTSRKISGLSKKRESVYERLSRIAKFNSRIQRTEEEREFMRRQDAKLKRIADENFRKNIIDEPKPDFLIDNFHWKIMRVRRLKHLTQAQLAKEISEPEAAIKAIEKGVLSRGSHKLIEKIEDYFGIRITYPEFREKIKSRTEIEFDPVTTKKLTIADLKEMQGNPNQDIKDLGEDLIFEDDDDLEFEEED